ncbi:MAG TPA: hypothetical protein VIF60_13400 [Burkholderiaceae bacterium]
MTAVELAGAPCALAVGQVPDIVAINMVLTTVVAIAIKQFSVPGRLLSMTPSFQSVDEIFYVETEKCMVHPVFY